MLVKCVLHCERLNLTALPRSLFVAGVIPSCRCKGYKASGRSETFSPERSQAVPFAVEEMRSPTVSNRVSLPFERNLVSTPPAAGRDYKILFRVGGYLMD